MSRILSAIAALALLSGPTALAAAADEPQPGPLAKSIQLVVKPDRFPQFEEALRQHLAFHRTNQDPWAWHTWQVVNGDTLGQYILRTHGHQWRDFDANADLRRSDWADFLANVAPHLEVDVELHLDPRAWPVPLAGGAGTPHPRIDHPLRAELRGLPRVPRRRREGPRRRVGRGAGPSLCVDHHRQRRERTRDDSARAAGSVAELEARQPPLWSLVEQRYGAEAAADLERTIGSTVRSISSSVVVYREDLSYQPAP